MLLSYLPPYLIIPFGLNIERVMYETRHSCQLKIGLSRSFHHKEWFVVMDNTKAFLAMIGLVCRYFVPQGQLHNKV